MCHDSMSHRLVPLRIIPRCQKDTFSAEFEKRTNLLNLGAPRGRWIWLRLGTRLSDGSSESERHLKSPSMAPRKADPSSCGVPELAAMVVSMGWPSAPIL